MHHEHAPPSQNSHRQREAKHLSGISGNDLQVNSGVGLQIGVGHSVEPMFKIVFLGISESLGQVATIPYQHFSLSLSPSCALSLPLSVFIIANSEMYLKICKL